MKLNALYTLHIHTSVRAYYYIYSYRAAVTRGHRVNGNRHRWRHAQNWSYSIINMYINMCVCVCLGSLSRRGGTTPTHERPIIRFHYTETSNYNIRTLRLHDPRSVIYKLSDYTKNKNTKYILIILF